MKIEEMEFILDVQPQTKLRLSRSHSRLLTSSLARLLKGGVPLLKGIEILKQELLNSNVKAALDQIEERIREGQSFSDSLGSSCANLPSYFIQAIQAGEISGSLDSTLETLSQHLEKEEEVRRKIREALAYPSLVLGLGFITLVVLLKFVIPKIALTYEGFGGELPWLTSGMLALGSFLIPLLLIFAVCLAFFIVFFRRMKDRLLPHLLRAPIIGNIIQKALLAHFASLLALQLKSGIPILTAIHSFKEGTSIEEDLSQGEGLGSSLKSVPWVDNLSLAVVISGEESGRLPEALEEVAKEAQKEVESKIHLFLKLLEPALILGIGVIVGTIVVSALLPLMEINEIIK